MHTSSTHAKYRSRRWDSHSVRINRLRCCGALEVFVSGDIGSVLFSGDGCSGIDRERWRSSERGEGDEDEVASSGAERRGAKKGTAYKKYVATQTT